MRMHHMIVVAAVFIGIAAPHRAAAQEQFFVEPLRAGVLSPNMQDNDSAFVVTREGARRHANEPAGSADRHYVASASADYLSSDWTYEVTFKTSANAPDDVLFIGFGEAVPDDTFFNEPRNSVNFRIHQGQTAFDTGWRVDVAAHDAGFLSFPYLVTAGNLPGADGGTHIARIRKVGTQVSFEILGSGIAVTIADITAAAPFLNGTPVRVFFGNASSAYSFSDVRVLQETAGWHL